MQYDQVYERFYELITDPDFYKQDETLAYAKMKIWLHSAASEPYIRAAFSELTLDDDMEEITYTLNNAFDAELNNDDLVLNIFASYMQIAWMKPKIEDALNLAFYLGGKEEKVLRNTYRYNVDRINSLETKLRKMIMQHGYHNGNYEGNS